jgi:hypothetical protein
VRRPPRPDFDIALCDEFGGFDIAICDVKESNSARAKLKHEILRESMPIALDRFIEAKRGDSVDFCEVAIQHDAHAPDRADHPVNLLD